MENFKKGQIVPKRLNIVDIKSKHRHLVTFGTDVQVIGNSIICLFDYVGVSTNQRASSAIYIKKSYTGGRKGRSRSYAAITINGLHVINANFIITP